MHEEESVIFNKPGYAVMQFLNDVLMKIRNIFSILIRIVKLPVVQLKFDLSVNPSNVQRTYDYFTKPHPTYKIFQNKGVGAELICLRAFPRRDNYISEMKLKSRAWRYAKKASARGYVVVEIDRNEYIDEIHEINTSMEVRQGRTMDSAYLRKTERFESVGNFKYFGALNEDGKLVAYCNIGYYGNFYSIERIIGHRNNDGVMHLMVVEMVCRLIDKGLGEFLMYDTYFGASPNMKLFKEMFGFKPYRVRFSIR